jgi:spore cortex formation protein SpoVR/YcgB (stage V sporulation)
MACLPSSILRQEYQDDLIFRRGQYNLRMNEPNIQVYNVDVRGDRGLTLRHVPHNNVPLADTRTGALKHLHRLWEFGVRLEIVCADGEVS